jgi:hypothetical protein
MNKMWKLTVMYDLLPGANHEEFVEWRTTVHQKENMSSPGVLRSDFYIVEEGWPNKEPLQRYITEAYFPDEETLRAAFFSDEAQAKLLGSEGIETIANHIFLISREVVSEEAT